jgi:hypothetical protein
MMAKKTGHCRVKTGDHFDHGFYVAFSVYSNRETNANVLARMKIEYATGDLEMTEFGNSGWPKAASKTRHNRPIRRISVKKARIANT